MDTDLEAAIDSAGRDRVFAFARANGWSVANTPPKWVWWAIINTMRAEEVVRKDGEGR